MKKLLSICLAIALALPVLAFAQSQSQGTDQNNNQSQASTSNSKTMSGTVSHDRKTFTSDKNSKSYTVDNPDALQGQQDQHVALVVHVDPDTNTIHILQIEAPPQR